LRADNPFSAARRPNVTGDIEALRGATIPSALLKLLQIQPRYHLRQLLIGDSQITLDVRQAVVVEVVHNKRQVNPGQPSIERCALRKKVPFFNNFP
jgi:hypothetical protein